MTTHFPGQTDLAEYHKLGLDISELEKKIMSEMIRPERALLYLVPGRLVGNSTPSQVLFLFADYLVIFIAILFG